MIQHKRMITNFDEDDWDEASYIKTPYMKCPFGLEGNEYKFIRVVPVPYRESDQIFMDKLINHLNLKDIDHRQFLADNRLKIHLDTYFELYGQDKLKPNDISQDTIVANSWIKFMIAIKRVTDDTKELNTGRLYEIRAFQGLIK